MHEVENKAIKLYEKNLEFFSKNHTNILYKIQALNNAIDTANYTPKYDLEYIKNYFDVKELSSNNYLYAQDSMKISKKISNLVNYNKTSYLFDGFPLYYQLEKHLDELGDKGKGLEGVYPIMTYYLDNTASDDEMKIIEKFIFIGTGLGFHIPIIDNNIKATEYFIIEDDLELFNLSLFCTPYYEFNDNVSLFFSIAEDDNTFVNSFNKFLLGSWFLNRYIKYSHFPSHSDKKIKLIQNVISSQDFTMFQYKTFLNKQLRPLEHINNGYSTVNLASHLKDTIFSEHPVLVLGSGPSLQDNLPWIKDNHNKFILVAVSSSLKILYENNITPDLVVHLDGFDVALNLFNTFPVAEFLKNSILLFGSFVPSGVKEIFTKEQCFFLEEDTFYFEGFTSVNGSCVGSTSILQSIMLDSKDIYLLGLDFAINSESGQTHSKGHVTTKKVDISTKDKLNTNMSIRNNLFSVEGNLSKNAHTNSLFHASIQNLYILIPKIKKDYQNIYNLCNGAKLNRTIPTNIVDIDILKYDVLDKESIQHGIYKTLKSKSANKLSMADVESLKRRVTITQEIKSHIMQYKANVSTHTADNYLYDSLGIISTILHYDGERETNRLVRTYNLYFKYTLPIIMDLLNTKGLKNTKRHIKKLDKLFIAEMLVIADIYEKTISEFIEERC